MKYAIIKRHSLEDLVKHVNALIDDGWTPQGGVSRDSDRDGSAHYCQAVVRTGDEPPIQAETTTTTTGHDPIRVVRVEGFHQ